MVGDSHPLAIGCSATLPLLLPHPDGAPKRCWPAHCALSSRITPGLQDTSPSCSYTSIIHIPQERGAAQRLAEGQASSSSTRRLQQPPAAPPLLPHSALRLLYHRLCPATATIATRHTPRQRLRHSISFCIGTHPFLLPLSSLIPASAKAGR